MLPIVPTLTGALAAANLPLLSNAFVDVLTSGTAVIIYLVVLLVSMALLILAMMFRAPAAPQVVEAPVEMTSGL